VTAAPQVALCAWFVGPFEGLADSEGQPRSPLRSLSSETTPGRPQRQGRDLGPRSASDPKQMRRATLAEVSS